MVDVQNWVIDTSPLLKNQKLYLEEIRREQNVQQVQRSREAREAQQSTNTIIRQEIHKLNDQLLSMKSLHAKLKFLTSKKEDMPNLVFVMT